MRNIILAQSDRLETRRRRSRDDGLREARRLVSASKRHLVALRNKVRGGEEPLRLLYQNERYW